MISKLGQIYDLCLEDLVDNCWPLPSAAFHSSFKFDKVLSVVQTRFLSNKGAETGEGLSVSDYCVFYLCDSTSVGV